mgnify:CR=1 FL=1
MSFKKGGAALPGLEIKDCDVADRGLLTHATQLHDLYVKAVAQHS